jgi:hypothetical protein
VFKKSLRCLLRVNCEHYLTHTFNEIRFFSRIYKKALYHLSFPAYSRGIDVFNMSNPKIPSNEFFNRSS